MTKRKFLAIFCVLLMMIPLVYSQMGGPYLPSGGGESASYTGNKSIVGNFDVQGTIIVDEDGVEALLVRKDGDGGDVFRVDTTNSEVEVIGDLQILSDTGSISLGATPDVFLERGGANILELRNGTTAQTLRINGTWTDASNYERGEINHDGSNFIINTTSAGSGTTTNIRLKFNGGDRLTIGNGGITAHKNFVTSTDDSIDIGIASSSFRTAYLHTSAVIGDASDVGTLSILHAYDTLTMSSGSSQTSSGLIPAGAFVLGVTTTVTTLVTGPAGYDVGDGTDPDRWGNSILVADSTTSDGTDATAEAHGSFASANDVVLTSDGVDFTAGVIDISVAYVLLTAGVD